MKCPEVNLYCVISCDSHGPTYSNKVESYHVKLSALSAGFNLHLFGVNDWTIELKIPFS